MSVVLPRLTRDTAMPLIGDAIADVAAGRAHLTAGRLPCETLPTTWPAVGDNRIHRDSLQTLRGELLDLARRHGMPDDRPRGAFDGLAARVLRDHLPLTPHEAAHDDAWTYLTCGWLLDIALWRFNGSTDPKRYLGDVNRNTFRRLWWRAEILGDIDLTLLGEDELVNIMERPTLTADRRLARTLASAFILLVTETPDLPRMTLMREATKRILRRTPFIDHRSLPDSELATQVRHTFESAAAAITGTTAPPPPADDEGAPRPSARVTVLSEVPVPGPGTQPIHVVPVVDSALTVHATDHAGPVAVDIATRRGRVTNENLRTALAITADQARHVLQEEVRRGTLIRRGMKRGTYYCRPDVGDDQSPPSPGRAHDDTSTAASG